MRHGFSGLKKLLPPGELLPLLIRKVPFNLALLLQRTCFPGPIFPLYHLVAVDVKLKLRNPSLAVGNHMAVTGQNQIHFQTNNLFQTLQILHQYIFSQLPQGNIGGYFPQNMITGQQQFLLLVMQAHMNIYIHMCLHEFITTIPFNYYQTIILNPLYFYFKIINLAKQ